MPVTGRILARAAVDGQNYMAQAGCQRPTPLRAASSEQPPWLSLYDPYGRTVVARGPLAQDNRFRFNGKPVHPGSGFYNFGYRFYGPSLQTWLSRDPIGESWKGSSLYISHPLD